MLIRATLAWAFDINRTDHKELCYHVYLILRTTDHKITVFYHMYLILHITDRKELCCHVYLLLHTTVHKGLYYHVCLVLHTAIQQKNHQV